MRSEHSGDIRYLDYEPKRERKPVVEPVQKKKKWEPEPTAPVIPDEKLMEAAKRDLQRRNIY